MMNKMKNFMSENELHLMFNYFKVNKILLSAHLKLIKKVHNHLFNLKHECLFTADFKHVYYCVKVYSENRYYFMFYILKIK